MQIFVTDGYKEYVFNEFEDANKKFLDILKVKLNLYMNLYGNDFSYFDVGVWMVLHQDDSIFYLIPSRLNEYLDTFNDRIFNHITVSNLQHMVFAMRIAKPYKNISCMSDRKNDTRTNPKDAE